MADGVPEWTSARCALLECGELVGVDRLDLADAAGGTVGLDLGASRAQAVGGAVTADLDARGGGQRCAVAAEADQIVGLSIAQQHALRTTGTHDLVVPGQVHAVGDRGVVGGVGGECGAGQPQKTGKLVAIAKQIGRRCCVLLGPTPIELANTAKRFGQARRNISLALNQCRQYSQRIDRLCLCHTVGVYGLFPPKR